MRINHNINGHLSVAINIFGDNIPVYNSSIYITCTYPVTFTLTSSLADVFLIWNF
jgi:hypothetical protein